MNREYTQFSLSLEKRPIHLWARIAIGASGAATLPASASNQQQSKGFASIVRNSIGNYTITLQDQYVRLMLIDIQPQRSAGSPGFSSFIIRSDSTNTSSKSFVIEFLDNTGAVIAADIPSGVVLLLKIALCGSSV